MSEPVVKRRPMIDLEEFERRLRQPPPASRMVDDDPLAELARLVGGQVGGQDDPYKEMFVAERAPQPAPRTSEAGIEADVAPVRSFRRDVPPAPRGADIAPQPLDAATPREAPIADYAPDVGVSGERWADEEYADPAELGSEEPRSRRPLYLMAAIIVVGIAGIGASFVLKGPRVGSGEVATIEAPEGPAKVAVETNAAASKPVGEMTVLERDEQNQRAGLVDTREQPVDLSQIKERVARIVGVDRPQAGSDRAAAAHSAAQVPVPAPPGPVVASAQPIPETPAGASAPVGAAVPIEPRKVKTISVRPDGTLVSNPEPARAGDVPLPTRRPPEPAPAVARPATPKIAERVVATPKPVTPVPSAVEPQAPAAAPEAAAAASGSYAVQLAAPASEQEARAFQVKAMKKHAAELAGFRTSIRKAVVGDRTVYRVRVGDLAREDAVALCQRLKSGGTACFVAKN